MPTKDEIRDFSIMIKDLSIEKRIGLMDAICHHCKESGLEIEVASTLISNVLKSKIREESERENLVKRSSRLPI